LYKNQTKFKPLYAGVEGPSKFSYILIYLQLDNEKPYKTAQTLLGFSPVVSAICLWEQKKLKRGAEHPILGVIGMTQRAKSQGMDTRVSLKLFDGS